MTKLNEFVPYLMRRSLARLAEGISADLTEIGLNHERWRVLNVLSELGPLTLNELANHVSINVSTLSRLIDRMIEEQLTARNPSGIGRSVIISLTDFGKAKLEAISPMIAVLDTVAVDELGHEDLEKLRAMLKRLYSAYDRFAARRIAEHAGRKSIKPLLVETNPQ
jgi:DNA-binding MarR family transcriptional regulator